MRFYLKCIPDAYCESVRDIDYQRLHEQGIDTLFFDLDNTLISYQEQELKAKDIQFLNDLTRQFKIVIISNSGKERVNRATSHTGFDTVYHSMKPTKKGFLKALAITRSKPATTCVIGDQLMTDVLGAKRMGFHAILVKAVSRKTDRWMTRINRAIERRVLNKIKKNAPELYEGRLKPYVESE